MELPFPNEPLADALIVGHVTERSARIWVRRADGRPAMVRVGDRAVRVEVAEERDRTAVIDIDGLAPDTRHPVLVDDAPSGEVRTLPTREGCERLCFAVVSCHLPYEQTPLGDVAVVESVSMLDALLSACEQRDVRFVLHVGDQVYADPERVPALDLWKLAAREPVEPLALYRELYKRYWSFPAMRALHARLPNLMVWDDGEIRDAFGSVRIDRAARRIAGPMVAAARRAYVEYQHAHNPATREGDLHYAFDAGPASFFVLDLRSHRDASRRRLLGARQWRALERWLIATDRRPVRFVVSSVPLLHTPDTLVEKITRHDLPLSSAIPDAFHDRWSADAFHHELERLLRLLLPRRGVIVLSGDIHIGAAIDIRDAARTARLPQWISSAITHESTLLHRLEAEMTSRIANVGSRWPLDQHFHELRNNFGIVEVVRDAAGAFTASFELWARVAGGAKPMYRVEAPALLSAERPRAPLRA